MRVVNPYNLKEIRTALREELEADGPSVIISRGPCALLKHVKHKPSLVVDQERCVGCTACMGIGCPAIRMRDGKAEIDENQCVGCDLCVDLCGVKAIGKPEVQA